MVIQKESYCKLSKTAIYIRDILDFPNVVCKIIGRYAGTDQIRQPGDEYIKAVAIKRARFTTPIPNHPRIVTLMFCYRYYIYNVYKVYRVTPCTFLGSFERAYHVFSEEWRSHTKFVFVSGRDPNKIYKPRRFYGSAEDDDFTSQGLAGINLKDAIVVPHDFNDNDVHYVPIGDVFDSNGQVVLR